MPRQHERDALPGADREIATVTVPVVTSIGASVRRCTASGPATARTPWRHLDAATGPRGRSRSAGEQLAAHRHDATHPLDDPHHARLRAARCHEVRDAHRRRSRSRAPCRARACRAGSGDASGRVSAWARSTSGRVERRRAAPRSRRPSRTAAGTASRSTRRGRRGPPCGCPRSARSPRAGAARDEATWTLAGAWLRDMEPAPRRNVGWSRRRCERGWVPHHAEATRSQRRHPVRSLPAGTAVGRARARARDRVAVEPRDRLHLRQRGLDPDPRPRAGGGVGRGMGRQRAPRRP